MQGAPACGGRAHGPLQGSAFECLVAASWSAGAKAGADPALPWWGAVPLAVELALPFPPSSSSSSEIWLLAEWWPTAINRRTDQLVDPEGILRDPSLDLGILECSGSSLFSILEFFARKSCRIDFFLSGISATVNVHWRNASWWVDFCLQFYYYKKFKKERKNHRFMHSKSFHFERPWRIFITTQIGFWLIRNNKG